VIENWKTVTTEARKRDLADTQMVIFKFIDDRDVFQKFYQKKLAQRLVHATSASDDAESSMISKLKEICGFDYTNKLMKMFTGALNLTRVF
jgi:cullin 1